MMSSSHNGLGVVDTAGMPWKRGEPIIPQSRLGGGRILSPRHHPHHSRAFGSWRWGTIGLLAQWIERHVPTVKVAGSIPAWTAFGFVAKQVDIASLNLAARKAFRFESERSHDHASDVMAL